MLTAGAARAFIDPPLPNDPQGYVRREAPALDHSDPLEITGVVLERGSSRVVILAADLTGYDHVMASRIREEVARVLDCDAAAVLLNASHSQTPLNKRSRLLNLNSNLRRKGDLPVKET
jgi:predicted exporter